MGTEATLGEAQIPIRAKLDQLDKDLEQARSKVGAAARGAASAFGDAVHNLGVTVLGAATTAVGAISAVGGAIAKLAIDAAPVEGVRMAFEGLATSAGIGGDEMLTALQAGSAGMVAQRDLMMSFNKAAGLVSTDFATQLPDAMSYLGKISAATGQDMGFLLDSLVTGVGRLSPMILDNLQIQVSLEAATARAAEMFGVEADELDKTQIQAGMMNLVLEKLAENTANMPDLTNTAASRMAAMKARFQDAKDEIGLKFLPVLGSVMQTVGNLADRVLPPLMEFIETKLVPIFDTAAFFFDSFVASLMAGNDPITTLQGALRDIGLDTIADAIQNVVAWVQELIATLQPYIDMAMEWVSENIELKDVLIALGIAVASVVIPAVWGVLSPILAIIAAAAILTLLIAGVRTAWENDFLGIRTALTEFWENKAKPTFETLKAWLEVNIPIAIETLKTFWEETLLPAIQNVWTWIQDNLFPLWETLKAWLEVNIPAAIETLRSFWEETLLPAIQNVWAFIQDDLVPLFEALWELIEVTGGLALEALAGIWENVLQPALETVWQFIQDNVLPILDSLWTFIKDKLGPKLEDAAGLFDDISGAVQSVIGWISNLTTSLSNIKLPDWMERHSPAPIEVTFAGMAEGLRAINAELGGFSLDSGAPIGGQSTTFGPINITTGAQPEEVAYSLESYRVMVGAT